MNVSESPGLCDCVSMQGSCVSVCVYIGTEFESMCSCSHIHLPAVTVCSNPVPSDFCTSLFPQGPGAKL